MDQDVVKLMDEETLSKYLPHFGDRVFAKNWTGSTLAEVESNAERKKTLIERIRAKMKALAKQQQAHQIILAQHLVWETRMLHEKQEK